MCMLNFFSVAFVELFPHCRLPIGFGMRGGGFAADGDDYDNDKDEGDDGESQGD